jgi:hypothetical protein
MVFLGMPRLELPSTVDNTRHFKSSGIRRLFTGEKFNKLVLVNENYSPLILLLTAARSDVLPHPLKIKKKKKYYTCYV